MSLAPACSRLREGTSGVDRSQAALMVWGIGPRREDWSDLWLDVIMRLTISHPTRSEDHVLFLHWQN